MHFKIFIILKLFVKDLTSLLTPVIWNQSIQLDFVGKNFRKTTTFIICVLRMSQNIKIKRYRSRRMNNLITNIYQCSCQGEPHFLHILKSYKKVYVICYYFTGQMRTSAGNLLPPAVNGTCEVPDNTDFCQNAGTYIIIWLHQKKCR